MNALVQMFWVHAFGRAVKIFLITVFFSYAIPIGFALGGVEPSIAAHYWATTAILTYMILMAPPWKRVISYRASRGKHNVFIYAFLHLGFVLAVRHIPDFLGLLYCGVLLIITTFVIYEDIVVGDMHDRNQEFIKNQRH